VEATPDAALQANLGATREQRFRMGIRGRFNTNGNDGTITRFGWKAQNKSLLIFSGEAYNVEQAYRTRCSAMNARPMGFVLSMEFPKTWQVPRLPPRPVTRGRRPRTS